MTTIEKLPSGLLVFTTKEYEPPAPVEMPTEIICAHCGAQSSEPGMLWFGRTSDGFGGSTPTCGHGRFIECSECRKKILGCPQCGCMEEYT